MAADSLVQLGAHTHTHQDFRGRPRAFGADLQTSIDIVRDRFGVEKMTFAFPFGCPFRGFAGADLVAAARTASIECALTTEAVLVDLQSDPLGWGRLNVFSWDTHRTLTAKLQGWYSWAPKLRRGVGRLFSRRRNVWNKSTLRESAVQ
jgi:hypothetical protein